MPATRRRIVAAGVAVALAGCSSDDDGDANGTDPDPPGPDPDPEPEPGPSVEVTTDEARGVGEASATLHGSIDRLEGAREADVGFECGKESVRAGTASVSEAFEAEVGGLEPGTEYEYRAFAELDGSYTFGDTRRFATEHEPSPNPPQPGPPATITVYADGEADAGGDPKKSN